MAASFNMILMCFAMLNVVFAIPTEKPAGVETKEDMKTADTIAFGFGVYPRYSLHGFRSGLGMSIGYPTLYSHSIGYLNGYPHYLPYHFY